MQHRCRQRVIRNLATRSFGQQILDEKRVWRSRKQIITEPLGLNCRTQSRDLTRSPHIHQPTPCHRRVFQIQHVSQLKFSAVFQFIFREVSTQCNAISAEVDRWRVTQEFVVPALDPCSDSHLLGVSAVKIDAPSGLISGSPIFLFFKLTSGSRTISL